VPFPDTVAVPTVVPPAQSDGALGCGPNTLNVTVPVGDEPCDKAAEIEDRSIALPAVPDCGAPTALNDGEALTTVLAIPAAQVEAAALLLSSPP
jgi:hypothetical protein